MSGSPTSRTLELLREMGYVAQVVEQTIPRTRTKRDLFGAIDVLAVHRDQGIIGIQATSGAHHAERVKKALDEPRIKVWIQGGGIFEVWSWSLRGKAGKRKLWKLRRQRLGLADYAGL